MLLFVTILLYLISESTAPDIIINPYINIQWKSQTFIIPPGVSRNDAGDYCREFSNFYCLHAYETRPGVPSLAVEYDYDDLMYDLQLAIAVEELRFSLFQQCQQRFHAIFRRHNIYHGDEGCCEKQCGLYIQHGFTKMVLTPGNYISKLTDYSEFNKQLNYIEAFFLTRCEVNIITKVGFGVGELIREDNPETDSPQKRGYPYILGLLDPVLNSPIPFENPGQYLTFRWFKLNVICREQEWICRNWPSGESSPSAQPRHP